MLAHFTATPEPCVPILANILPPIFQASWPPPQGSVKVAPGRDWQMVLIVSRDIVKG